MSAPDFELAVIAWLTSALPGVTVTNGLDVDAATRVPLVVVTDPGGTIPTNGPADVSIATSTMTINALAGSVEAARDLADRIHDILTGPAPAVVANHHIGRVRPVMLPTRVPVSTVAAQDLHQVTQTVAVTATRL